MKTAKLVLLIALVLIFIPFVTHYYLTRVNANNKVDDDISSISNQWVSQLEDVDKLKGRELKRRIEELLRIKYTVSVELRELEEKRQKLQNDMGALNRKLDDARNEANRRRSELDRLQISVQQAKVAEKEAMERNTPRLGRPKPLNPLRSIPFYSTAGVTNSMKPLHCDMDSCFDFSLCPIATQFKYYLYPMDNLDEFNEQSQEESESRANIQQLYSILASNDQRTSNYLRACVFIALVTDCSEDALVKLINFLPHWLGDGRNHLLWLNCGVQQKQLITPQIVKKLQRGMLVSQTAVKTYFRPSFDIVVSSWEKSIPSGEVWSHLPPISPAKRKYLATYLGGETESTLQSELLKTQQQDPVSFVFQFSCNSPEDKKWREKQETNEIESQGGHNSKSARNFESYANKKLSSLCENELLRTRLLLDSTFSLIILPSENYAILSTDVLQLRLYETLKYGAIPVVLGTRFVPPLNEVIDWSRLIITLPVERVTELHYLLKAFTDADIFELRRHGRLAFQKYFSSVENVVESLFAAIRTRIGVPAPPFVDCPSPSVFNDTFTPSKVTSFSLDPEEDENLGPLEPSYPSSTFARNFSSTFLQKYDLWNLYFQPIKLFPHTPWDPIMPSEAKFTGSSMGFRPIAGGVGGSGKEFSESLGGNLPKEQFTVVMLTYEREQVLLNSLQRLYALPYLNKVVVVWNSPVPPASSLSWPDIGVPIQIVKASKNSLNNRFLPYDAIETEAVLSIDDDAHLRHDEIVFGFRVWRENRDRVVGFPGRFHAWDLNYGNWLYNSNYSCELSMVLTGAAFYHKLYSYLYTYEMSQAIRDKVDELMNCEDIAMNFLVSHVTQKPPVKVTSRWTFRCPGCPVTLSEDDSHFQERHHCINFFSKVYGYTPLQYTQFRADSILFKTRIPHDKQKCFKYI